MIHEINRNNRLKECSIAHSKKISFLKYQDDSNQPGFNDPSGVIASQLTSYS